VKKVGTGKKKGKMAEKGRTEVKKRFGDSKEHQKPQSNGDTELGGFVKKTGMPSLQSAKKGGGEEKRSGGGVVDGC